MLHFLAITLFQVASFCAPTSAEVTGPLDPPTTTSVSNGNVTLDGGSGGWAGDITAADGGSGGWAGDIAAFGGSGGWAGDITATDGGSGGWAGDITADGGSGGWAGDYTGK